MAIKIRLNEAKRAIYEELNLAAKEKLQNEISDLWREIRSQTDPLGKFQTDMVNDSEKSLKTVPDISKLTRVKNNQTGEVINPAKIAEEAEDFLSNQIHNYSSIPDLIDVLSYWKYPIIWTFEIDTACTDGIRIAFNPFFYDMIQKKASGLYSKNHPSEESTKQNAFRKNLYAMLPFLFVIVHEAYHQLYLHIAREKMATFVPNTAAGHADANYAQDAEINRDITLYHFPILKGGFDIIQGVDESDQFDVEDWEQIFQAFASGKKKPKWPEYFNTNKENKDNPLQWQEKQQNQQNSSKPTPSFDYNKGYQETYNKLADVWNKTRDVKEVAKTAEEMGLEINI